MMNYVIIDTNVLVSALLAPNRHTSVPFSIIRAVFLGKITPVLTSSIMDEYHNVLAREKFGFNKEMVKSLLEELKSQAVIVDPPKSKIKLPDSKDLCFYEAAAVYENVGGVLVTGNVKHFPNCPFVVTPSQLKEKLALP